MLGRKKQAGSSSLDLTTIESNVEQSGSSTTGRAFSFLLERAKGAVFRTRSTSSGQEENARPRLQSNANPAKSSFFSRTPSTDGGSRTGLPFSASMSDLSSVFSSKRNNAVSTSSRPPWLASPKPSLSSSSPVLSDALPLEEDRSGSIGSRGARTNVSNHADSATTRLPGALSGEISPSFVNSSGDMTRIPEISLPPAQVQGQERKSSLPSSSNSQSFLSRPASSFLTRHSSEDLRGSRKTADNRSRTPSEESAGFLGVLKQGVSGVARSNPQPSKSSIASSSMSKTSSSSSSTYDSLSNHTSVATSIPFPTSASTPNFKKSLSATDDASTIDETSKRDSQTVLCQGFLQRKADYSPAALASTPSAASPLSTTYPLPSVSGGSNSLQVKPQMLRKSSASTTASNEIDLQRGWRPFKVVLQGSKLYLYKMPTGELTNTVKSLFPTTIVIDSDSPVIPSPRLAGNANPNLDEFGARKKQRAFWGTGKVHHPGLVVSEGKGKEKEVVTGGSLEALVHELVFATTFLDVPTSSPMPEQFTDSFEEVVVSREATINLDSRERQYEKFLDTILTFWPFLPTFTPKSFSLELDRCSVLGVRTIVEAHAKDSAAVTKESAQLLGRRLELILRGLILSFSEDLLVKSDGSDVKAAVQELIRLLGNLEEIYLVEGEPKIALELAGALSKVLDGIPRSTVTPATEWTNTRPVYSRQGSSNINSASSTSLSNLSNSNTSPTKPKKKISPAPASQEFENPSTSSLNHSNFLNFDALHLAQQIRLFHQDRYTSLISSPEGRRRTILKNAQALAVAQETRSAATLSLFSFSSARPSYLTKIIYSIIFPAPPASLANRVKIIERWIVVAEELRRLGDAAGFVAVASTICSPSVARLTETWKSIDSSKIALIRNEWVPILAGLRVVGDDGVERIKPLVLEGGVPYWGDVLEQTSRILKDSKHRAEDDTATVDLLPFYRLREVFQDIDSMPKAKTDSTIRPDSELQHFFQTQSRLLLAASTTYFSASLDIQPKISGLYVDSYTKPRPSASEPPALLPLLMVEPLPHISLVNRDKIIQVAANVGVIPRKQSNSDLGSTQEIAEKSGSYSSRTAQPGRLVRHNSFPPSIITASADVGLMTKLRLELNRKSESERNLLRLVGGNLVLRIITSTVAGSGPSTPVTIKGVLARTASWIEAKSTKAGRRASIASISTLSPLSQVAAAFESGSNSKRSSLASTRFLNFDSEESSSTVGVVVKSGTIESLVDLLVIGIPAPLRVPSTIDEIAKSIKFNSKDFRITFFSTYRAFVTPITLLDMLRKRYISARNVIPSELSLESPFPIWSTSPSEEVDWKRVVAVRTLIVVVLRHWVEHHLADFLNDEELLASFAAFLNFMKVLEPSADGTERGDEKLREEIDSLSSKFFTESLRPQVRSRRATGAENRNAGFSFDRLGVAELVDRLDVIASEVTANVQEQDLICYAETLEGSTATNPVAWYSSRQLKNVDDEDVVIQDPYSHLIALGPDPTFLLQMPPSLSEGLKMHRLLRSWILAHLVDPDISLPQRQARMEKAISMIEMCRARMSNVAMGGKAEPAKSAIDPSLASFVERVVISAVVAPESRLFASAWQGVAFARRVVIPDSLAALLRKDLVLSDATSTLDFAWLNERLLEIVTQVDNLAEGGTSINFDKRRLLHSMVSSAMAIRPAQTGSSEWYLEAIEKRMAGGWGSWGMRILKDVASTEGTKSTKSGRPFQKLVVLQQEKMRRDKQMRDYVAKGMRLELQIRTARDKEVAKAMDKSNTKHTRRMTAMFKIARPESPVSPSPTALQSLNEWTPNSKPFIVFALSGVQVVSVDNVQRSFVFELATEDGQRSIFQATSKGDLENWLRNLRQSGNQIAFRRATFLAQTALAEEPEEPIVTKAATQFGAAKGYFGIPLWQVLEKEGTTVPLLMEKALRAIEEKGLAEVGIYRISGENRIIHSMKDALNQGDEVAPIVEKAYVHDLTGLVKLFLRELPNPLIPFDFYHAFIEANNLEDYDERLFSIRDLIWRLPQANFYLLRRLIEHLDKVTDNEGLNSMHAGNIAICFAPTLLRPPPGPESFGQAMSNLGKAALLIKSLILTAHWIFAEESEAVDAGHTPEASDASQIGLGMDIVAEGEDRVETDPTLLTPTPLPSADSEIKPLPPSPTSPALVFHDTLSSPVLPSSETF